MPEKPLNEGEIRELMAIVTSKARKPERVPGKNPLTLGQAVNKAFFDLTGVPHLAHISSGNINDAQIRKIRGLLRVSHYNLPKKPSIISRVLSRKRE